MMSRAADLAYISTLSSRNQKKIEISSAIDRHFRDVLCFMLLYPNR